MPVQEEAYQKISDEFKGKNVVLVAVSKTKPAADILELYQMGHRDFGENYVQELVEKYEQLPKDIRWHFIGHLQSNKVKYIIPFVHLIHGVDSYKLLKEVNKQASRIGKVQQVLLQVHIATEETKFGLDAKELSGIMDPAQLSPLKNILVSGLMGMASFTEDQPQVRTEFSALRTLYDQYKGCSLPNTHLSILSMGMSSDFKIAVEEGSTMVRIGSLLFGERSYG